MDEIRSNDPPGDYSAVRYYPPTGDIYFDVMVRLGEMASFEAVNAEIKTVEGIRVRVATPAALDRLKKRTVRPLDRQEVATLAQVVTPPRDAFERFLHCARCWAIAPRNYARGNRSEYRSEGGPDGF